MYGILFFSFYRKGDPRARARRLFNKRSNLPSAFRLDLRLAACGDLTGEAISKFCISIHTSQVKSPGRARGANLVSVSVFHQSAGNFCFGTAVEGERTAPPGPLISAYIVINFSRYRHDSLLRSKRRMRETVIHYSPVYSGARIPV